MLRSLLGISLLIPFLAGAQTVLERGAVRFQMEGATTDPTEGPVFYTVYFKPDTAAAVLSLATGETVTMVYQYPESMVYTVIAEGDAKMALPMTMDEFAIETAVVEYHAIGVDAPGRTILGYLCYRMFIEPKSPDEGGLYLDAWVTNKIRSPFKMLAGLEQVIPGFPLELAISQSRGQESGSIRYRALSVEKEAPEIIFRIPE